MKKKILPVLIIITLILVLSVFYAASLLKEHYEPTDETMDLSEYYGITSPSEAAVILDTYVTEEKARMIDGRPYISFSLIREALNPRFYYDANEKLLLLTEGTSTLIASADTASYTVNSVSSQADAVIFIVEGDTCYIDAYFVAAHSDLDFSYYDFPSRLVFSVSTDEKETAVITDDTEVRYRGGIKSEILTPIAAQTEVTVHARDEKWTEVATSDGIIGYVPSGKLSSGKMQARSVSYTAEEHPHIFMDHTISLAWHQITNKSANRDIASTLDQVGAITVISPTWFYLNDNAGNIADFSSSNYVDTCHERGIAVWGLISNLENPDVSTAAVLGSTSIRTHLIDQLIEAAVRCGMDGINVDFESLKADAIGDSFIQFIRELSLRCSENHLILSVDNYVMSSYTAFYNRAEQARFADYIIIMAYDEHYNGSDDGSVASLPWVEEGLVKTIEQVPANQIILGNPFYTRIWKLSPKSGQPTDVVDEEDHSSSFDISSEVAGISAAAAAVSEHGATVEWSEADGQNYAQWEEDNDLYRVWLEDESSMKSRMRLIGQYNLAGAAFWKLGFENQAIWDVIDTFLH